GCEERQPGVAVAFVPVAAVVLDRGSHLLGCRHRRIVGTYRRAVRQLLAVCLLLGAAACSDAEPAADAEAPPPSSTTTVATTTTTTEVPAADDVLLAWIPGGLPPGFAGAVAAVPGVRAT